MLGRRPLLVLVCSTLILLGASESLAGSPGASRVVVEIDASAEKAVKARLTRRLISLEIGEVGVPPAPGIEDPSRDRSLFVRVVGGENGRLRVELWEHGVFHGARQLSTSAESSQRSRSRHIALAAAELARRLRRRRLAEALGHDQQRARDEQAMTEAGTPPPVARVALRAASLGAMVGPGNLYLAGPGLAGLVRSNSGANLQLSMSWLFGTAPPLAGSTGVRWLEIAVAPSYTAALGQGAELDIGAAAAAASLNFSGAAAVDDIPGQLATWSARAAAIVQLNLSLSQGVLLQTGSEVGAMLRRAVVVDEQDQRHRLGGLWLGATLGVVLDPGAPSARRSSEEDAAVEHASGPQSAPRRGNAPPSHRSRADNPAP